MEKKCALITILMLAAFLSARGQQRNGTYSFLDITDSPRVAALGGSITSIVDGDIQLALFNPSLIDSSMHNALSLAYVDYFTDVNFGMVQYARHFNKIGSFAASLQYHNYGKFDYADQSGAATGGTFSAADYNFVIGWGRRLNPHFSIGANVKFVGNQYEDYNAFALAVDVAGTYYSQKGWTLSVAGRNIGMELYGNYDGPRTDLPFHLQASISKRLEHVPFRFIITYNDIQKWDLTYDDPLDLENEIDPITGEKKNKTGLAKFGDKMMRHLVFGGEIYIGKNVTLRVSYNYKRRQDMKSPEKKGMVGFSYGLSVHIYKFDISYSRAEMHNVGAPNYFSITTNIERFTKNR